MTEITVISPAYTVDIVHEDYIVDVAAVGRQGLTGDTGPQGPQGAQGIQGIQGIQGVQGPQGDPGEGLNIVGTVADYASLPVSPNFNDGYITSDNGHLWVWNSVSWVDTGEVRGPQGPQGIQGVQGPQGIQGEVGPQGPQGIQGVQGDPGEGLNIVGTVANYASLPVSANFNDGYILQDTGHLWVWNGSIWIDAGQIQGPPGPIGLESRADTVVTATNVAPSSGANLDAPMGGTFAFIKCAVNQPDIRVRVYISPSHRTADGNRPVGVDPTGDHGLILEFISRSMVQSLWLSPAAIGYITTGTDVPIRVDNVGSSTVTAQVTLTWLKMEA